MHFECFTLDTLRLVSIFLSHPSPFLHLSLFDFCGGKKKPLHILLKVDKDLFLFLETGACYVAQSNLELFLLLEYFLSVVYVSHACTHVHT